MTLIFPPPAPCCCRRRILSDIFDLFSKQSDRCSASAPFDSAFHRSDNKKASLVLHEGGSISDSPSASLRTHGLLPYPHSNPSIPFPLNFLRTRSDAQRKQRSKFLHCLAKDPVAPVSSSLPEFPSFAFNFSPAAVSRLRSSSKSPRDRTLLSELDLFFPDVYEPPHDAQENALRTSKGDFWSALTNVTFST